MGASLKQAAPSSLESEHARFAVVSGISSPTHHSPGLTRPRRDLTHNPIPPPGTSVARRPAMSVRDRQTGSGMAFRSGGLTDTSR